MATPLTKAVRILGHIYFLVLFILAGYYYLERTIVLDSALQIFKWIQFDGFNIEAGRLSAIIPQLLPKLAIWSGLSVNAVLLISSLSFILVFYIVFLIVSYKWRSDQAAIGVMFALTLCSLRTFYFSVVEVHQALVYPFLFLAWLIHCKDRSSKRFYIVALLLMSLNFLTHPTTLMTVLFVLGYFVIDQNKYKEKWPYVLVSFTVLFFLVRWFAFDVGTYEAELYSDASSLSGEQAFWMLPGIQFITDQIWKNNTLFLIPSLLTLWALISILRSKRYLVAVFSLVSIFLFIVITALAYQRGDSAMMMEKNFLALGVFISIVFVQQVLLSKRLDWRLAVAVVAVILGMKVRDIALSGAKEATPRLAAIATLVSQAQKQQGQKFKIDDRSLPDQIKVDWALPVETILLSSAKEDTKVVTVISAGRFLESAADIENEDVLIIPLLWPQGSINDLDQKRFPIGAGLYDPLQVSSSD